MSVRLIRAQPFTTTRSLMLVPMSPVETFVISVKRLLHERPNF